MQDTAAVRGAYCARQTTLAAVCTCMSGRLQHMLFCLCNSCFVCKPLSVLKRLKALNSRHNSHSSSSSKSIGMAVCCLVSLHVVYLCPAWHVELTTYIFSQPDELFIHCFHTAFNTPHHNIQACVKQAGRHATALVAAAGAS
jgi:hypothetical protein